MKAIVKGNNTQAVLTLIPESADDQESLREFALKTARTSLINCRGFQYLESAVEFLVQPMTDSD